MEKLGKHNHKLTNILKIAIFSLVMLAPIGAVLSKVAYISINKNAYQSYSNNTTQYQLVETYQEIDINKEYYIQNGYKKTTDALAGNASNNRISINLIEVIENPNNYTFDGIDQIGFYSPSGGTSIGIYMISNGTTQFNINSNNVFKLKIQITNMTDNFKSTYSNTKLIFQNNSTNSLDNAFYYACNQLTQEPLFNWTINTGTYTAINAMFTGLGMQSNHPLAICLCYWMICTMIYIVIDIVIFCITKLTHITNDE